MPTDTLENAQAWRKSHLDPARIKGQRYDENRVTPKPTRKPNAAHLVSVVNDLMGQADDMLEKGERIDHLLPSLRSAMLSVPQVNRDEVWLYVPVMNSLLAPILAWLPPREENPTLKDGTPLYCDGASMTDEDAQAAGEDWYKLACGEISWDTPSEEI